MRCDGRWEPHACRWNPSTAVGKARRRSGRGPAPTQIRRPRPGTVPRQRAGVRSGAGPCREPLLRSTVGPRGTWSPNSTVNPLKPPRGITTRMASRPSPIEVLVRARSPPHLGTVQELRDMPLYNERRMRSFSSCVSRGHHSTSRAALVARGLAAMMVPGGVSASSAGFDSGIAAVCHAAQSRGWTVGRPRR
jgi:hypothetical protein